MLSTNFSPFSVRSAPNGPLLLATQKRLCLGRRRLQSFGNLERSERSLFAHNMWAPLLFWAFASTHELNAIVCKFECISEFGQRVRIFLRDPKSPRSTPKRRLNARESPPEILARRL